MAISPDLGRNYQPPAVPCRGCDRPLYVALASWESPATAVRWCESCASTGEAEPEARPRGTKGRRMTSAELGIGESVMAPSEVIEERRRKAREREEAAVPQQEPISEPARRDIERRVSANEDHGAIARRYGIEATTVRKIAREERKARDPETPEPIPSAPMPGGPDFERAIDEGVAPVIETAAPVMPAEPSQEAPAWVVSETTEHPIIESMARAGVHPSEDQRRAIHELARKVPRRGAEARAKKSAPPKASNARRERIFAAALAGVVEVAARERDERDEELAIQVGISALTMRLRLLQVRRLLRAGRVEEAGEMLGVKRG